MITALLLRVPAHHVLLADGPFGARPPIVERCGCGRWGHFGCAYIPPKPRALVVAWGEQEAELGLARIAECIGTITTSSDGPNTPDFPDDLPRRLQYAWHAIHFGAYRFEGEVVVLRREVGPRFTVEPYHGAALRIIDTTTGLPVTDNGVSRWTERAGAEAVAARLNLATRPL